MHVIGNVWIIRVKSRVTWYLKRMRLVLEDEFLTAMDLEKWTGTKASTWRYWAHVGQGPDSFKLGRRRLWRRSVVETWIREQEVKGA